MRWSIIVVLGVWIAARAGADEAGEKELQKLQGTWIFISIVVEGKDAAQEVVRNAKLTISGRRFSLKYDQEFHSGLIFVDPSKSPKTIDVIYSSGADKDKKSLGIYELRNDALKVCIGLADASRPTEFVSKPNSRHLLEVLKLQEP
jgi:uncharacterized protein (TIGR03067 family)